jgi:4a-hydroxytetrahydrobiopterin dehydratase
MAVSKAGEGEVQAWVSRNPAWAFTANSLTRTFQFPDFVRAMQFVNRLAEAAEEAQHHPDLDIRYNKVTVALTTHDAGGVTQNDFDLAVIADEAGVAARGVA